jgi:hypothetical protein
MRLTQIAPVVWNDGTRERLILYALDAAGVLWWLEDGISEGWAPVEGPPDSSGVNFAHTTGRR